MSKRSYKQNCALARAVDVVGERWTLLLIRDLLVGTRRFGDLARSLKGIGTNLLADRLKELEATGLIERRRIDGSAQGYALTASGRALEPAILSLVRWGLVHGPQNQPEDHHQDDWDLVALKALFQSKRAGDLSTSVQFDSEALRGWVEIEAGTVSVGLGRYENPDLVIAGTIGDLFTRSESPASLLSTGDAGHLHRFMGAFALRA